MLASRASHFKDDYKKTITNRTAGEIVEEPMEPDEEKKLDLRREKQAARSSRTIYDLQQQVQNQVIYHYILCVKLSHIPYWMVTVSHNFMFFHDSRVCFASSHRSTPDNTRTKKKKQYQSNTHRSLDTSNSHQPKDTHITSCFWALIYIWYGSQRFVFSSRAGYHFSS